MKELHLFARNLTYKYIFDTERGKITAREEDLYKGFKVQDFRALKTLSQLLDENEGSEDSTDPLSDEENADTSVSPENCKFKAKSQKFPNLQTFPAVWAFLKQTRKQIENFSFPQQIKDNLSQAQHSALNNITQNDQIVVKPSDKGGNVVLMDKYIEMCNKILRNQEWFYQFLMKNLSELDLNLNRLSFSHINGPLSTMIYWSTLTLNGPLRQLFTRFPRFTKIWRTPLAAQ